MEINQPQDETDLSGYVPYTGATRNVNLNGYNLDMDGGYLQDVAGLDFGSGGIISGSQIDIQNNTLKFWNSFVAGDNRTFNFDASGLTNPSTRTYTVPNASGTLALTSDIRVGKITTAIDTYGILVTDETVICNKATAFTVTLPTAVVGQRFNIKNIGVGIVTVDGADSDLIDDVLTQDIEQWECVTLQCYAANKWAIL